MNAQLLDCIKGAVLDQSHIRGLTHTFYRYPARFSPAFARSCIEIFSKPGQIVLDPFMGGGTTIIESMVCKRRAIGSDVNSLSVFISLTKTSILNENERRAIGQWASFLVPALRCNELVLEDLSSFDREPQNMNLPTARWLRKTIAQCIASANAFLPSVRSQRFARCVLLNVGQWALNGRRRIPTAEEFRCRITRTSIEMLSGVAELADALAPGEMAPYRPLLRCNDAERIDRDQRIRAAGPVDLVVTSPPYPGIHMLYHRWQVDGRKETDAPYWISACEDGAGAAFYNFADRRRKAEGRYFEKAASSYSAIRRLMRHGAILAQLIAFSDPERQLNAYLDCLASSGFEELPECSKHRTWRYVPGRKWHATSKGDLPSSREVVLLHRAI